jgi:hypothetical protein
MKKILLLMLVVGSCNADVDKARKEAREFIKHIPGATDVTCNPSDSDGDGYVSCTVFRGDKDPLAISCGAENFCACNCARGCKLMPYVGASKSGDR